MTRRPRPALRPVVWTADPAAPATSGPKRRRRGLVGGLCAAALLLWAGPSRAQVPGAFDWRNVDGRNYTAAPRNQGQCGSNWAFAAITAMQAMWKIESNDPTANRLFSAQELVSCNTASPNQGCNGGNTYVALAYLMSPGVVDEACYPYLQTTMDTAACVNVTTVCPGTGVPDRVTISGRSHLANPTVADMQQAIMAHGPITASFLTYDDFMSYRSGVYTHSTGSYLGGHAVAIVGWGTDPSAGDYWICENSWGASWGEQGFFRIRRGTNECDIEHRAVDVITGISGCQCIDGDGDGFVDPGCRDAQCTGAIDCQPHDPASNPDAAESCDGIDNDCDDEIDQGVLNACGECGPVPAEVCDGVDNDCDGQSDGPGLCGGEEECRAGVCAAPDRSGSGCSSRAGAGAGSPWVVVVALFGLLARSARPPRRR